MVVDEQGFPSAVRIDNTADPDLGAAALAILRGWQFSPAMRDGKPVAVTATFELVFGAVDGPKNQPARRTTL